MKDSNSSTIHGIVATVLIDAGHNEKIRQRGMKIFSTKHEQHRFEYMAAIWNMLDRPRSPYIISVHEYVLNEIEEPLSEFSWKFIRDEIVLKSEDHHCVCASVEPVQVHSMMITQPDVNPCWHAGTK